MTRTTHHRGYNRRRSSRHVLTCGCCVDHNWNHAAEVRDFDSREALTDDGYEPGCKAVWRTVVNVLVEEGSR